MVNAPCRSRSYASQPSIAAAVATWVLTKAMPATPLAASAEPALKPNQPNQSRPEPSITSGRLCGRIGSLRKPTRLPSTRARASPAAPALMCTAVPPAKSITPLRSPSQPPWPPSKKNTQCATGK